MSMSQAQTRAVPELERDEEVAGTLFRGAKQPMTAAELKRTLAPVLAQWIRATCRWDDTAALGDYRFLVFSIDVAPKVQVYVQFWSEPGSAVACEVSSGKGSAQAEKWLAGERSQRIQALGFELGGEAENFQKDVVVRTAAEAARLARTVVDIFHACFDYRGQQPVDAYMAYESRAESRLVYDGFTPEDLLRILAHCGFAASLVDDREDAPVIRAVRAGVQTMVTFADRVADEWLFLRAVLTSDGATPPREMALLFDGGVTVEWVVRRLEDWEGMTRPAAAPRALSPASLKAAKA
jgi:hypothetical protein